MAYKVFTNGSVLQASEVNDNLMKQAVATFSNAAARSAAITSPVEGQMTYLEDVNLFQHWNGSAWRSPFGSTLLASTSFTSTSALDVDNVFSSEFDAYQVVVGITSSNAVDVSIQYRVSGTTATTANYDMSLVQSQASLTGSRVLNATSGSVARFDSNGAILSFTISNPFLTRRTYLTSQAIDSNTFLRIQGVVHTLPNSYTGFRLNMDNTSGDIRVYGLRK